MSEAASQSRLRAPSLTGALGLVVAVVGCVFVGAVVALGAIQFDVLLLGVLVGAFLLAFHASFSLWVLAILTLVISGIAEYFFRISQAQWTPALIAFFLYLKVFVDKALARHGLLNEALGRSLPLFVWLAILYLGLIALSVMLNQPQPAQALVGAKNYVPFWSVLFLLSAGALAPNSIARMWWGLVVIAFIQLPFVLYENIVVMRGRGDLWAFDSVVGTFGGDPRGGGSNSALVLFMFVICVFAVALWRRGLLGIGWVLAIAAVCVAAIALGEAKIVAIFLPVASVLLFWDKIRTSPLKAIGLGMAVMAVLAGLLVFYQSAYWNFALRSQSVTESVQRSIDYIIDPRNIDLTTGEVGRVASLNLWREDPRADAGTRILGYGIGASRSRSSISIGEVARRYMPLDISATAAAALLWDVGVLGFSVFCAILVLGAIQGFAIARKPEIPVLHQACLKASAITLCLMLIMVPYNRYVVDQASVQFLMMFCLGQIAFWQRIHAGTRS